MTTMTKTTEDKDKIGADISAKEQLITTTANSITTLQ
jgi:hypothetical protein